MHRTKSGRRGVPLTPTRLGRPWCLDPQLASKIIELRSRNRLCHEICEHPLRRTVLQQDLTIIDLLAHEVVADVNMLGALVILWVLGQRD